MKKWQHQQGLGDEKEASIAPPKQKKISKQKRSSQEALKKNLPRCACGVSILFLCVLCAFVYWMVCVCVFVFVHFCI